MGTPTLAQRLTPHKKPASTARTAAASEGMLKALSMAFKSGAIAGLLVLGLSLLDTGGYYYALLQWKGGADDASLRAVIEALVARY